MLGDSQKFLFFTLKKPILYIIYVRLFMFIKQLL